MEFNRVVEGRLVVKDGVLYAKEFFEKLEEQIEQDFKEIQNIDPSADKDACIDRTHPAKKILNRFSGRYMSPTMIKGYYYCPASQFLQNLTPWDPTSWTAMGTTFHSVMEDFYSLPQGQRTFDKMDEFTNKYLQENHADATQREIDMIWKYVNGYKETPDYLNPNKPMDHNALVCFNEYHTKGMFKPLGVELPLPMYTLMDRLDIRDEGMFIIDYKTGAFFKDETFGMDGYLPQMIVYKWAIEEQYGEEVQGAYILTPGVNNKIHKMDINSLKNQSMFIEKCFEYRDKMEEIRDTKAFPIFKPQGAMGYIEKNCKNQGWTVEKYSDCTVINVKFSYDFNYEKKETKELETKEN